MKLQFDEMASPLGGLLIAADSTALFALDYVACRARMIRLLELRFGAVTLQSGSDPGGFSTRTGAYFDGQLDALQDVEVKTGGTPFQRRVWAALRKLQPGQTASYAEIAASIGRPMAARAVGAANAANAAALAIPCHRVLGAGGALTGYAGGIIRKRWLLEHEGALTRLSDRSKAGPPAGC